MESTYATCKRQTDPNDAAYEIDVLTIRYAASSEQARQAARERVEASPVLAGAVAAEDGGFCLPCSGNRIAETASSEATDFFSPPPWGCRRRRAAAAAAGGDRVAAAAARRQRAAGAARGGRRDAADRHRRRRRRRRGARGVGVGIFFAGPSAPAAASATPAAMAAEKASAAAGGRQRPSRGRERGWSRRARSRDTGAAGGASGLISAVFGPLADRSADRTPYRALSEVQRVGPWEVTLV